jgi:hypothetical protein
LSSLVELGPLLHDSRIEGRKKKSAVDTALLLTEFVEQRKLRGLKPLVVFLDVNGAFDHVAKGRLLTTMQSLKTPKKPTELDPLLFRR